MEMSDVDMNIAPPWTSALLKTDSDICDIFILAIDHLYVCLRMDKLGKWNLHSLLPLL